MSLLSEPTIDCGRAAVRILRRYNTSSGQGLLEVVLVVAFFSTLVAVATPVYLGLQGRKADKSAQENLVSAVQMAEAYRQDHGSYAGMDALDLYNIDPRLSPSLAIAWVKRGKYCLTETVHGKTWSVRGPYKGDAKFSASGSCD